MNIQKLPILLTFYWYFTTSDALNLSVNDMIVGLHVPNNLPMYRLNSEKHYRERRLPPPIMLLFVLFSVCTIIMLLSVGKLWVLAPQYPQAAYSTAGSPPPQMYRQKKKKKITI